jgi:tRNA(Ile)-lysidine synthase
MENSKKPLKNSASVKKAGRVAKQEKSSQPNAPSTHPLLFQLRAFLTQHLPVKQPLAQPPKLLLALSGGLDSCVLLHLLAQAQRHLPFELHAMHVHHGLSSNADAWAGFCSQQCQSLNVPLQIVHVEVDKTSKDGIEAAARQLRYQALFNYQFGDVIADFVVTAHHQDDQAETMLLQLFRGAGVKGLSCMAASDKTRRLLRPLLNVSRLTLHEYAVQHQIEWCDDESNENTQYERNFIRHEVMPVLESRFQSVKSVLARTASHLAEANTLLDTLATLDARELLLNNSLCLQGLSQLDIPRAKNVLRWWFAQNQLAMPTAEYLTEIMQQLLNAKPDADLSIKLQHLTLKRYQQRAYLCIEYVAEPFDMVWNGEATLTLPNGGQLQFKQVSGAGLALKFGMSKLRITNRGGGERFKPNPLRPTRTLKHLLQEANIPPWQRLHLPLIYWQDTLACVPGIGVTHELQANGDELGLEIVWQDAITKQNAVI